MPGVVALLCLFALYWVTMLILWSWTRRYRTPLIPRREEAFRLPVGHTILGVIKKRNTLYFCLGDVEHIQDYE